MTPNLGYTTKQSVMGITHWCGKVRTSGPGARGGGKHNVRYRTKSVLYFLPLTRLSWILGPSTANGEAVAKVRVNGDNIWPLKS